MRSSTIQRCSRRRSSSPRPSTSRSPTVPPSPMTRRGCAAVEARAPMLDSILVALAASEERFLEHVQAGGLVEAGDPMPERYRSLLLKFIAMHANSELMGVLPEREWILRAPTLQRKLALTAKVQDEVGHARLMYRVAEDLGKPRDAMFADLLSGKAKFHNVFHYPTHTWGDVGVIAWLVDAAAIISQKALLKCSYAPYARIMKKICWE